MKTINVTPRWAGIMPFLIHTLQTGERGAREATEAELMRLARAMDQVNSELDELNKE